MDILALDLKSPFPTLYVCYYGFFFFLNSVNKGTIFIVFTSVFTFETLFDLLSQ